MSAPVCDRMSTIERTAFIPPGVLSAHLHELFDSFEVVIDADRHQ
jgi:hypothetical protein